jgi:hypothetical protein
MTQLHREAGKDALIRLSPYPAQAKVGSSPRNHRSELGTRRVGGVKPSDAQPRPWRRVSFSPLPLHTPFHHAQGFRLSAFSIFLPSTSLNPRSHHPTHSTSSTLLHTQITIISSTRHNLDIIIDHRGDILSQFKVSKRTRVVYFRQQNTTTPRDSISVLRHQHQLT